MCRNRYKSELVSEARSSDGIELCLCLLGLIDQTLSLHLVGVETRDIAVVESAVQ